LVAIYHPIKDRFDLARAVRCKQKKSFVSHKIIQRNKLFSRIERGSIRLPWQEKSLDKDDADKFPNTRFHVIADDKFRYDIAIGEGFDDPDSEEEEDNAAGSDQEIENHPGDEEDEGTSSVDAELPMAARRSHPRMSRG
jgi:hypothetical protein